MKQCLAAPNAVKEHPRNIADNEKNLCLYCGLEQRQRYYTCIKLRSKIIK